MKKLWPWIAGILAVILLGTITLFGIGILRIRQVPYYWMEGSRVWNNGYWHHHGPGMRWGMPMMGMIAWVLILGLILGFLVLVVIGVVLLIRSLNKPGQPSETRITARCRECGRPLEPDWQVCPHCGTPDS